MIYTDKIHLVADTLEELHEFAKSIGIGRWYYEGLRKCHPHYDIPRKKLKEVLETALVVSSKELLLLSWRMYDNSNPLKIRIHTSTDIGDIYNREVLFKYWPKKTQEGE